jgi:hypothetical protein
MGRGAEMKHYEAPESVKYHGGYDPSDPPQGEHWCSDCSRWDDECSCLPDDEENESNEN